MTDDLSMLQAIRQDIQRSKNTTQKEIDSTLDKTASQKSNESLDAFNSVNNIQQDSTLLTGAHIQTPQPLIQEQQIQSSVPTDNITEEIDRDFQPQTPSYNGSIYSSKEFDKQLDNGTIDKSYYWSGNVTPQSMYFPDKGQASGNTMREWYNDPRVVGGGLDPVVRVNRQDELRNTTELYADILGGTVLNGTKFDIIGGKKVNKQVIQGGSTFPINTRTGELPLTVFEQLNPDRVNYDDYKKVDFDETTFVSDIEDRLNSNPRLRAKVFNSVEDFLLTNDEGIGNNYRNYHDTMAAPVTPNQMTKLMAGFYNEYIKSGGNSVQAYNWLDDQYKAIAASKESFWTKTEHMIPATVNNIIGEMAVFAGNIMGIADLTATGAAALLGDDEAKQYFKDNNWANHLMHIADNDVTRWGDGLMTTGQWGRARQDEYKERGYNPYSPIGSDGTFHWSTTPFELVPQIGFTVAGMYTGQAAGQVVNATIRRGANRLARKAMVSSSEVIANSAKTMRQLGNKAVLWSSVWVPAQAEASSGAMQVYDNIMSEGEDKAAQAMSDVINRDLQDSRTEEYARWQKYLSDYETQNPDAFDDYIRQYLAKQRALSGENATLLDSILSSGSDEDVQAVMNSIREEYEKELLQKYKEEQFNDRMQEIQDVLQDKAIRNAAMNFMAETAYISAGDRLFSLLYGPTFKAIKKGTGYKPHTYHINELADGTLDVVQNTSFWDRAFFKKMSTTGKAVQEVLQEGAEEAFQSVSENMFQDVAYDYINEYFSASRTPEGYAISAWEARDAWRAAKESIGRNIGSDETIYSFFMGAMGSAMGSPTIRNGVRTRKATGHASFFDYWRNPIVESIRDSRIEDEKLKAEQDDLKKWVNSNKETLYAKDAATEATWVMRADQSVRDGDPISYSDAIVGGQAHTIFMMDKLKGSAVAQSFQDKLDRLKQFSTGQEDAETIIQAVRQQENDHTSSDEEIAEKIRNKATEVAEMQQELLKQREALQDELGTTLSQEGIEARAYEYVVNKKHQKEVNELTKRLNEQYNSNLLYQSDNARPEANVPTDVLNAAAIYQDSATAQKAFNEDSAKLSALQKQERNVKNNIIEKRRLQNQIAFIKDRMKEERQAIKDLQAFEASNNGKSPIVLRENIMRLSNRARAELLNGKSSGAQRAEITAFLKAFQEDGTTRSAQDIKDDAKQIARLENLINQYNLDTANLYSQVGFGALFDTNIRERAAKKVVEAELRNLVGTKQNKYSPKDLTYEQFYEQASQYLQKVNDDPFLRSAAMSTMLKSAYGQKFFRDRQMAMHENSKLDNSYSYNNIDNDQIKRIVRAAFGQAVNKKKAQGTPDNDFALSDNMLDIINSDEFKNTQADNLGISVQELQSLYDDNDINTIVRTIASSIKTQERTAQDIRDRVQDLAVRSSVTVSQPEEDGRQVTIEDNGKSIYNDNKSYYDSILQKLVDGKNLTSQEALDIVQIITGQEFQKSDNGVQFKQATATTSKKSVNLNSILQTLFTINSWDSLNVANAIVQQSATYDATSTQEQQSNTELLAVALQYMSNLSAGNQSFRDTIFQLINNGVQANISPKVTKKAKKSTLNTVGTVKVVDKKDDGLPQNVNNYLDNIDQGKLIRIRSNKKYRGRRFHLLYDPSINDVNNLALNSLLLSNVLEVDEEDADIQVDGKYYAVFGVVRPNDQDDVIRPAVARLISNVQKNNQLALLQNEDNSVIDFLTFKSYNKTALEGGFFGDILQSKHSDENKSTAELLKDEESKNLKIVTVKQQRIRSAGNLTNKTFTFGGTEVSYDSEKTALNEYQMIVYKDNDTYRYLLINDYKDLTQDGKNNINKQVTSFIRKYTIEFTKLLKDGKIPTAQILDLSSYQLYISSGYIRLYGYIDDDNVSKLELRFVDTSASEEQVLSSVDVIDANGNIIRHDNNIDIVRKLVDDGINALTTKYADRVKLQVNYNTLGDAKTEYDGERHIKASMIDTFSQLVDYGYFRLEPVSQDELEQNIVRVQTSPAESVTYSEAAISNIAEQLYTFSAKHVDRENDSRVHVSDIVRFKEEQDLTRIKQSSSKNSERSAIAISFGSQIDHLFRNFFHSASQINSTKESRRRDLLKLLKSNSSAWNQLIENEEQLNGLIDQLENTLSSMRDNKEIPVSPQLDLGSEEEFQIPMSITIGEETFDAVATPDLITVDKQGYLHIYDFKTYLAGGTRVGIRGIQGASFKGDQASATKITSPKHGFPIEKWTWQTKMYAKALQDKGYRVADINIVPVALQYDVEGQNLQIDENSNITSNGKPFALSQGKYMHPIAVQPIIQLDQFNNLKQVDISEVVDGLDIKQLTNQQDTEMAVEAIQQQGVGPYETNLDDLLGFDTLNLLDPDPDSVTQSDNDGC